MTRWTAAATHLGISAVVAAIVCGIMLTLWYPPPYFSAMGGETLLVLIVGCDVVLGPLITMVIFKSGKKGLKLDLTIVGCVQMAALAYGAYTIFIVRPVFTVFVVDRFEVVAANDISPEELAKAHPEFSSLSITGPRLVAARPPADQDEGLRIATRALQGGDDVKQLPRLYVPYSQTASDAARRAKPLAILHQRNASFRETMQQVTKRTGKPESEFGFLPVSARNQSMAAIIDRGSGVVEDIVPINPW